MKFKALLALLAATGLVTVSGNSAAEHLSLKGTVLYAWGQTLSSLDLVTHQKTILTTHPDRIFESIAKIDSKHFLVQSNAISINASPWVETFDRSTGQSSTYFKYRDSTVPPTEGPIDIEHPIVMPSHGVIVFYGAVNHTSGIYWAKLANPSDLHLVEKDHYVGHPLVPVSDDAVVYYDGSAVKIFNLRDDSVRTLSLPMCVPYLWRSKTHQLLCSKGDSFEYFLTNLDGTSQQELDVGNNHVPLYYIDELDVALFNGERLSLHGEVGTLWQYDFASKSLEKIGDGVMAGNGALVWYH